MNFENEKIIVCLTNDIVIYWVHNLDPNKTVIMEDNDFVVYKSNKCLYLYYKRDFNNLYHDLNILCEKNYIHLVMTDFADIDYVLEVIDHKNKFDYSIVNHMGETLYDNQPRKIKDLNNIKYYFSCGDLLSRETNQICDFQNTDKFILDYKYSLIYFYFKLGFNFFEKGNLNLVNENRKDKLFVYSKNKEGSERGRLLDDLLSLDRTYNKSFNDDDVFWNNINYNNYHLSFYVDYISCKLNLITETQPPSFNNQPPLSRYITEKTLKGLIVPTPFYLLSQKETCDSLKDYGFYFLNEEFGEYNLDNYKNFVTFIKQTDDIEFNNFFQKTFEKSRTNKIKLEDYIYSVKTKELKLLLNE